MLILKDLLLSLFVLVLWGVIVYSENHGYEVFNYCLRDVSNPGLKKCIGRSAISFLQGFNEIDNFTLLSDLVAEKDENIASRSIVNFLDQDPVDFRGILESAGALISQRSLQWHLDNIYPGLMLKVGPSADSNSVAEFALDSKVDERFYAAPETSTAKVLTRQYLLPMLLGFKFNLAVFVPLIFGLVVLFLKKSLFLVKAAIYITSLLGVGGAASLGTLFGGGGLPVYGPGPGPGLGHGHFHGPGHLPHFGGGPFPGKTGIVGNYHSESDDVLSHDPEYPDYSRKDNKVVFEKPREFVTHTTTALPDRFYDYDKSTTMNERSGKMLKVKKEIADFSNGWDGWRVIT